MHIDIVADYEHMSEVAAQKVAEQINLKPNAVIGFATGSTPLGVYHRLIRMHRDEGLDFSKLTCFNLDEYLGLSPEHDQSYHHFMQQNLFLHVNVNPASVYVPAGKCQDPARFCAWYEERIEAAGGVDLQLLGLGVNGHLAFNEPGSSFGARTRVVTLTRDTVEANARFFDRIEDVPRQALTMGIGTILESRKLLLLASGVKKADAIRMTLEGPMMVMVPSTAIQLHAHVEVVIDEEAASRLVFDHHDGIAEPYN